MEPDYWACASRELAQSDPILKSVIDIHVRAVFNKREDAFTTLARAIVGQQLSVRAAASVWAKLLARLPAPTPAQILAMDQLSLRECGLSGGKARYLHDLALHFLNGMLQVEHWQNMECEAIIEDLTKVKGIGRWTAEMFLIFHLRRPDVLPLGDLGVQRAMNLLYNQNQALSPQQMQEIALNWQPWRSVATWYLWRSLEAMPVK